jgi:8-oxo-dGTP pyrophosphatase MutT (NUDIX family)
MFSEFIIQLTTALQNPLPGKEVQIKMAPYSSKVNEKFKNRTEKAKTACVLVLFYPLNNIPHIVLMKRPSYDGPHSGQVSLPGGKWELSDESFEYTALREAQEELNIEPSTVEIVGQLSPLFIPPSNFEVLPFLGICQQRPTFIKDPKEVDAILEIDIPFLLSEEVIKSKNMKLSGGLHFDTPYFDIQNEVVWGATAMMLFELRTILKEN